MTITHEPVHTFIHRPLGKPQRPQVDVYVPRRDIRVDTSFWQHKSIFAGSQEQLNQLRREADERAARRARQEFADYLASQRAEAERSVLAAHRPAKRRLKAIVHVGLVPMLWNITTCQCGDRWPCNQIKQYFRRRLGWTTDITEHLTTLTKRLPKPATRLSRLRDLFARWRTNRSDGPARPGVGGNRACDRLIDGGRETATGPRRAQGANHCGTTDSRRSWA